MTAMIVVLFLVGPVLIVPLGMQLVPPLGHGLPDRIMRGVRRVALPAGLLLALAFALPAGPSAAALAVPWLLVAGLAASAAGIAALRVRIPLIAMAQVRILEEGATQVLPFGDPPPGDLAATIRFDRATILAGLPRDGRGFGVRDLRWCRG